MKTWKTENRSLDTLGPLFASLDDHLAVRAMLERRIASTLYVDDSTHPQAALIFNKRRYFLAGSSQEEQFNEFLQDLFFQELFPQAIQAGGVVYNLFYSSPDWEPVIQQVFSRQPPAFTARQFYRFHQFPPGWPAPLPDGFRLEPVTPALLGDPALEGRDNLADEMCSERSTVAEFLEKSFGVCLVHDHELAGWCLSEYNCTDACEIGIETRPAYRKLGLGAWMNCAFVEQALARKIASVGWHCYTNNLPSAATARKAGFRLEKEYPAALGCFNPVYNLALHGDIALDNRHYEQALAYHRQAIDQGETRGWPYFEAACAAARLAEPQLALDYLAQAIQHGFVHKNAFTESTHLENLRCLPAFLEIVDCL